MNSSKRGAAYGFRLQSLDLVSGKGNTWTVHFRVKARLSDRFYFLSAAVRHQIHRPNTDAAALHRQHHPGELPTSPGLLRRAALPGQGGAR